MEQQSCHQPVPVYQHQQRESQVEVSRVFSSSGDASGYQQGIDCDGTQERKRPLQRESNYTTVAGKSSKKCRPTGMCRHNLKGVALSSKINSAQLRLQLPVSAYSMLVSRRQKNEVQGDRSLYLIPSQSHVHYGLAWLKLRLGVTELAGEAGSGKSQMAMSLCVQAALNGHQEPGSLGPARAIYLSLAGGQASTARIAHRMQQMADSEVQYRSQQQKIKPMVFRQQNQNLATGQNPIASYRPSPSILSNILTHVVRNQDDLFSLLLNDLPDCLHQQEKANDTCFNRSLPKQPQSPVALIVLDSIADLFRLGNVDAAFGTATISRRSLLLFELARILKELSDHYSVPILVINQVSANSASNRTLPTLGLSWENCVNTSYFLRRQHAPNHSGTDRQVLLMKSSCHRTNKKAAFQIDTRGISPC